MRNEHYDSEEAYLAALADALRVEYAAIVRHGFLLQLDCPDLALERHITYQDRPLADFLGFVERVVGAINRALEGVPRDRVRLHVCWGNYEGPHDMDVPLAEILPVISEAKHAKRALKKWMKPHGVWPTSLTIGLKSWVQYEPKGRCLIVSPWNYNVNLSFGPLVSCIAAGSIEVAALVKGLAARGFAISNGYGDLKGKTFRIGHMGDHTEADLEELLAAADAVLG